MRLFQKFLNRVKQDDDTYLLSSYWTAADSVEFDDGETLEECKVSMDNALDRKGDGLFYDDETNMLYLLSGDTRLNGVEITTGGTGEVLGDVSNVSAVPTTTTVTLKWTDPQDGNTVEWAGTTVIRKEGSRPVDCLDGVVVVDSTTRNQYSTVGFEVTGLKKNATYWFRFFPYTTEGQIRTGLAVAVKTLIDDTIVEEFPTVSGTYTYNGSVQNVTINNFDSEKMVLTSGGSGTDAGSYDCVITLKSGYYWPDSSTDPLHLAWSIQKGKITTVPSQFGAITYSGTERTPSWSNYSSDQLTISGDTSGTNAGTYTATFTPTANYTWSDESVTGKDAQWTIQRATIQNVPSQYGTASYTGSTVTPTWNNYDSTKMTISGQTSGTEIGNYVAVFTPTSNYQWSDLTTGEKEVTWSISAAMISTVPSQSGSLTYTGNSQSPVWSNYDSSKLTIGGTTSGTDATTYTATFTPKSGYQWYDGTTSAKNATWVIGRQNITLIPSQSGSLTYNVTSQSPTWSNYSSSKLTLAGTTSATNAGTYTATFTPTSNYQWEDSTTSAKNVSWVIGKANGAATLSKASVSLSGTASDTVTVSNATGNVSVSSNNSSVCTASLSGSTITITGVAAGSTTVTVSIASNTNYYSATKSISVEVETQDDWSVKTWNGFTPLGGDVIWTDGNNIYYSDGSNQYVLNKSTSTWNAKTWNGYSYPAASQIWTDGNNIYLSFGSQHYVLNKTTSTWETKTWNGLTYFNGNCIWSDGNNIYYSSSSLQYVLDKATSTWNTKNWNGLTNFYGYKIWSDGNNIYYSYKESYHDDQYVLDKSTSTWNNKTWYGLSKFDRSNIWSDENNIYYSNSNIQYVLDKSTSTWVAKTWTGLTDFSGRYIWTDGDNIYYSSGSSYQYILND